MTWTTSETILPDPRERHFVRGAAPLTLQAAAGGGTVEIQMRGPNDAWSAIHTMDADDVVKIDVAGMPAIRIVASGGAQPCSFWAPCWLGGCGPGNRRS